MLGAFFMGGILRSWSNYNARGVITSLRKNRRSVAKLLKLWVFIRLTCCCAIFAPLQSTAHRPVTTWNQAICKVKRASVTCTHTHTHAVFDRINNLLWLIFATAVRKVLGFKSVVWLHLISVDSDFDFIYALAAPHQHPLKKKAGLAWPHTTPCWATCSPVHQGAHLEKKKGANEWDLC